MNKINLITAQEVGEILGKNHRTVSRLTARGLIPAAWTHPTQGIVLYFPEDVEAFKRSDWYATYGAINGPTRPPKNVSTEPYADTVTDGADTATNKENQ